MLHNSIQHYSNIKTNNQTNIKISEKNKILPDIIIAIDSTGDSARYQQRSIVENVFSGIKRMLGEYVTTINYRIR